MKPLEDELRRALRRREPPPGFTERMLARVRQEAAARALVSAESATRAPRRTYWGGWTWLGPRFRLGFAATAAALLLVVSVSVWRQRREEQQRKEGKAARAQVMEALRITSAKLNHVRTKVQAAAEDGRRVRLAD